MSQPTPDTPRPYSLTEAQLHRLLRAKNSMQVVASVLEDADCSGRHLRKASDVLELVSEDMERVMRDVERTYAD